MAVTSALSYETVVEVGERGVPGSAWAPLSEMFTQPQTSHSAL